MSEGTVLYILSVAVSIYAAYLFAFRTYRTDVYGNPTRRYVYPYIVYILVLIAVFVPILNIGMVVVGICMGLDHGFFCVKSWLFEKPE